MSVRVGSWSDAGKPFRIAALATVATLVFGGWAYLYVKSRANDLRAASESMTLLRELKALDSRYDDWLIGTRLELQSDGAAGRGATRATVERTSAARINADLALRAQEIEYPLPPGLFASLRQAFDEKADAIEGYHAAAGAYAQARAERGSPEGDARFAAAAAAEDRLFRAAFFASTGPRLESATRALETAFEASLAEAERFRWYLLVYSAFVVLLAAWLGLRLAATYRAISRLNRKLREANEFLEHRVQERTKELSNALTQLKEQETLLIQSEKMSSLGQMVAGVAHEVNTPLAYVKSSLEAVAGGMPKVDEALGQAARLVELLQADQADERELTRQFASVHAALADLRGGGRFAEIDGLVKDGLYGIGQIAELVTNLRNFARLDRSKVAEFDLNEGVQSALAIAKNQIRKRTVRRELGRIPKVACAPSQINQVLLNLLTNAAQATAEDGGVISVRTVQPDPDHVAIEVADNGHGIPPDVLPKIFDPFFTTKEVGKGTGLGLSICYKIVESHGGRISAESKVGVGTRFVVILPVKASAAALEKQAA